MCERVSDSYRDRVVLELLQNAHDAHESSDTLGRIKIILDVKDGPFGSLTVANDGIGFSAKNFNALCSPTLTTKGVNEAIGNKGVGFLSVFQVSSFPEIYSRMPGSVGRGFDGYCFRFASDEDIADFLISEGLGEHARAVAANMPRVYLASPCEECPAAIERLAGEGFATAVRLPLKNSVSLGAVEQQIAQLAQGDPPIQLFLSRIAEFVIESPNISKEPLILTRVCNVLQEREDFRLLEVQCGTSKFIVAERKIPHAHVLTAIDADVAAERLPDTWLAWKGDAVVSLAVAADGEPLQGRLYNFLPMGFEAKAPFDGHLDAPFYSSIDRLRLQPGVGLNEMFLTASRDLAIEGARAVKNVLPVALAKRAVADLLFWHGDERAKIREALEVSNEALIPALSHIQDIHWAALTQTKLWDGDKFITHIYAAKVAPFPVFDLEIGPKRLARFVNFSTTEVLTGEEKAQVAEAVAADLLHSEAPLAKWNEFYNSLANLFRNNPALLADRRLLLTSREDIEHTSAQTQARGRRGTRLSAVFLPPLRAGQGSSSLVVESLPFAVQRRLTFVHSELEIAREGASAARRFLLSNGLIRDYETREILRLLSGAVADPGGAVNAEALRWSALSTIKRIVSEDDSSSSTIEELNLLVPTISGWSRASEAYFGAWRGTNGGELQQLFEESAGQSQELDEQSSKLLRPYREWQVSPGDVEGWVNFLKKAGVSDHLKPLSAFAGPQPRGQPSYLAWSFAQSVPIGDEQTEVWKVLLAGAASLPNPFTHYTANEAYRLPGQRDFAALTSAARKLFARQIVRMLEVQPSLLEMTVYRPQHSHAPNRKSFPSPIAAFVRGIAWIPVAKGGFEKISNAWLPASDGGTPPPCISIVDWDFRSLLTRCESALATLQIEGLQQYGSSSSAWPFLVAAGNAVASGVDPQTAERILAAAQETWPHVWLRADPPENFKLIGRRGASIVAISSADAAKCRILVADGDDRQIVAAMTRAVPEIITVEPPFGIANEFVRYLGRHFPHIERASRIVAHYESDGAKIIFDPDDRLLEEEIQGVRDFLILALRYRCSFYRGGFEEALQRLSTLRIRLLNNLSFRFGDHLEVVQMFDERAVVLRSSETSTILVSQALRVSPQLMIGISEALGEAVGSRKNIGEPLLALAATLLSSGSTPTANDYARALNVSVHEIIGVLGTSRTIIAENAKLLRPFVQMYAGEAPALRLVPGADLATDDDILTVLDDVRAMLPMSPNELFQRCRESPSLVGLAITLNADLEELNNVLLALGPPYSVIDLTAEHEATLAAFLSRKSPLIRESIRASYRPLFASGADLDPYINARDSDWPRLPLRFGLKFISLPQNILDQWLTQWMMDRGVRSVASLPTTKESLESVREVNLRTLRALIPIARIAVLAKKGGNETIKSTWSNEVDAERTIIEASMARGWIDFDRLDQGACLDWLAKAGFWPANWKRSLADQDLGITDADKSAVLAADARARTEASSNRKQVKYSGGTFFIGNDSYGALADKITELAQSNVALQQTPNRIQQKGGKILLRTGRGGSGGGGSSRPSKRMPEEERALVGFFGEMIAFSWLKTRFGKKRIIDEACWRSLYRTHVFGGAGDDSLGYDFEVQNGKHFWYFEVKATAGLGPQPRQMIELGSSEIAWAENCRAEGRTHYRILYVVNALAPEAASLFVLPNPRSKYGLGFFAEQESAGVRLYFPLLEQG
ncbi:hypothetical protein XH96_03205 [Bradyrhizobium sp. CCBAU 51765]|nr:hypothetical protein XH96_03205 [Bradyrhizobium sp. CCBAU 51765]